MIRPSPTVCSPLHPAARVVLPIVVALITGFATADVGAQSVTESAATAASYSPATLPGRGLAQHPFLYAGEWDYRKPEQTMYIVRDGKVQWTYSIPIRAADSTLQEWGDATLRSDGNIVFSRKTGAGIVTPDKRLIWNYDAPKGTEVHVAQPIGLDQVMIVQNGPQPKAIFFDVTRNTVLREQKLPVANPANSHGQFRAVRYTRAGTILAAHMDWNKVAEYDSTGRVIWQVAVLSPWTALRLPNGNTLVSSNYGFVKEFTPAGTSCGSTTRPTRRRRGSRCTTSRESTGWRTGTRSSRTGWRTGSRTRRSGRAPCRSSR